MSNESPTKQLSVGVWAIIIASLVLSTAAILLHLTKLMDHLVDRSSRYGIDVFQVQNQLNQTRAELNKLQADIASATSFSQLKRSIGMPAMSSTGAPPPPWDTADVDKATSPAEVVMLLEQAQKTLSFEDYQSVQPAPQRKQLEDIYQANRDLKLAYQALFTGVEEKLAEGDILNVLNEHEVGRLAGLLFPHSKRYEILETIHTTDGKATTKVKAFITQEVPGSEEVKETAKVIQLNAVLEGTWWKVADDAQTQADQKAILAKLKEQTKQVKAITQQALDGKFKNKDEFRKAWDALPMIKK